MAAAADSDYALVKAHATLSATLDRRPEYPVSFGGKDRGEDEVGQIRRHCHQQPLVEKGFETAFCVWEQVIRPAYSAEP